MLLQYWRWGTAESRAAREWEEWALGVRDYESTVQHGDGATTQPTVAGALRWQEVRRNAGGAWQLGTWQLDESSHVSEEVHPKLLHGWVGCPMR